MIKRAFIPILILACLFLQAFPQAAAAGDQAGSENVNWIRTGSAAGNSETSQAVIGKSTAASTSIGGATVGSSGPVNVASGASALSELVMAGSSASAISPLTVGSTDVARTKSITSAPVATLGTGSSIGSVGSSVPAASFNATGTWSLELKDYMERSLKLTLYQIGDVVTGYGNLDSGTKSTDVAAAGSVSGGSVDLFVSPAGGLSVYRMRLAQSGQSLSGDYQAYSSDGAVWSGTANAETGEASGSVKVGNIQKEPSPSSLKIGEGQNESVATISAAEAGSSSQAVAVNEYLSQPTESGENITSTPTGGRKITRNENIVASESGAVTSTSSDGSTSSEGSTSFNSADDSIGVPRPAY
ncbi:MAG TPA: hypothetical protein VN455_04195 [Methanotrichaceae archaeon]|nr:hypothetical protein [Methanotrichaceae archaeon]